MYIILEKFCKNMCTNTSNNNNKCKCYKNYQKFLNDHPDNRYLLENEDGSSMTETQGETCIAYVAKNYILKSVFSVHDNWSSCSPGLFSEMSYPEKEFSRRRDIFSSLNPVLCSYLVSTHTCFYSLEFWGRESSR